MKRNEEENYLTQTKINIEVCVLYTANDGRQNMSRRMWTCLTTHGLLVKDVN